MARTPEGAVKAAVKKFLSARGIWYYAPMQNGYGVVGIPDFICCWGGRFLAIETKAPGRESQTTANQKARLAEIQSAGGVSVVISSVAQLQEILDHEQQGQPSEDRL